MTVPVRPPWMVLLIGVAVGADAWALRTYGLGSGRLDTSLDQVMFWSAVPAVVAGLLAAPVGPGARARSLARSFVVAIAAPLVVTGLVQLLAQRPHTSGAETAGVVTFLTGAAYGWLALGGLGAAILHRPNSAADAEPTSEGQGQGQGPRPTRAGTELVVEVVGCACAVGIGLTMPMTTRGLAEADRLGMSGQVRALVTGWADPTTTQVVLAYLVLLIGAVVARCVQHGARPDQSTPPRPPSAPNSLRCPGPPVHPVAVASIRIKP